jgi:hypothetical protein
MNQSTAGVIPAIPVSHDYLTSAFAAVSKDICSAMRLYPGEPDWNEAVRRAVVILSASRSGSSMIFNVLSSNGDVVAPAGEHEPWLFLSGNKYPFTASDALEESDLQNRELLLTFLRNDLLVRAGKVNDAQLGDLVWNRLATRQLHTREPLGRMVNSLYDTHPDQQRHLACVMRAVGGASRERPPATHPEQVGDDYYQLPIENPPHITQPLARRATLEELECKVLLFKSPGDVYRPGFYEALFPRAKITYLHLTRGLAQTINGLMDGWTVNELDYISNPTGMDGRSLAVEGYSCSDVTRAYWCYDLFPGWARCQDASLLEVCSEQWWQAHTSAQRNFPAARRLAFEGLYRDRRGFFENLETATGIRLRTDYDWSAPVMATEQPSAFRWWKRRETFRNMRAHVIEPTLERLVELQGRLGYSMDESTWH